MEASSGFLTILVTSKAKAAIQIRSGSDLRASIVENSSRKASKQCRQRDSCAWQVSWAYEIFVRAHLAAWANHKVFLESIVNNEIVLSYSSLAEG